MTREEEIELLQKGIVNDLTNRLNSDLFWKQKRDLIVFKGNELLNYFKELADINN